VKVVTGFERRDWLTAFGLFVIAAVMYAATRTKLAYLWDSVEFALAIRSYNVTLCQPHAPGYFLYVMLGRLVDSFLGDPHASLVWLSVACGAGLVAAAYLTGAAMFGRTAGLTTGLITLSSPMIWFYSSVALTYVVDAFLVTVVVLICWRCRERNVPWSFVVAIGVLMAVIGGIRQQSVPGLLPLVGLTICSAVDRRGLKLVLVAIIWAGLSALWLAAMLKMTGGWHAYWSSLTTISQFHAHKTLLGGGLRGLVWNVFFAGLYCFNGLLLGVVSLPAALLVGNAENRTAYRFLLLWILPVFLLATLAGYTEAPGHVMTYLPGLLLMVGGAISQLPRKWSRTGMVIAIVAMNVFVFLAWPPGLDGVLWKTLRTNRELRTHDKQLEQCVVAVRKQFRPQDTVICFLRGNLLFGLRHFQFYLPEFEQVRVDPDRAMIRPTDRPLMANRDGKTVFVSKAAFGGKNNILLVHPSGQTVKDFEAFIQISGASLVPDTHGMMSSARVTQTD
jgi:4-amino-4-deoxy-L-arabinose transferase-like glycosyltransferase